MYSKINTRNLRINGSCSEDSSSSKYTIEFALTRGTTVEHHVSAERHYTPVLLVNNPPQLLTVLNNFRTLTDAGGIE